MVAIPINEIHFQKEVFMKNSAPEISLSQCPHGHVLLRLGMTTLHLTMEQLRALSESIQDFISQTEGQTAKEAPLSFPFSSWRH